MVNSSRTFKATLNEAVSRQDQYLFISVENKIKLKLPSSDYTHKTYNDKSAFGEKKNKKLLVTPEKQT